MPFNRVKLNSIDAEDRGELKNERESGWWSVDKIGETLERIDNIREIIEIGSIRRRYD